ncbi:MAG TPA: DUF3185 family protein [Opitutaceae bacterium]|nr:DUF3185 family protein [Opitutaceae bacterium]
MNRIVGIALIVIGAIVFMMGFNRKNSLVGEASSVGTSVANSVDGGARTPKHVGYMIVGGLLAVAGIGVTARGSSRLP